MKRKSTLQSTDTAIVADSAAEFLAKNVRSKIPRRKRAHISPVLIISNAADSLKLNRNFSFNSTCDEVSCNTTLESVVLPPNGAFQAGNEVIPKPLKKEVAEVSVSENSCVESCSVVAESKRNGVAPTESTAAVDSPANTTVTVEQRNVKHYSCDSGDFLIGSIGSDLACSEQFSYDDYEVSSATNFSELESEIHSGNGESEFDIFTDEYTPSLWLNSGSQFSEKSGDDSSSPCFSLFKEYYKQFLQMSSDSPDCEVTSLFDDQYSDELAYWKFEVEEDEESYRMLRSRERNQAVKAKDYVEEYDFATDFGELIVEQRLLMVNWIIELPKKKDLQNETLFLGVRLLDRFLSKGFFTSRKNLQLLGIACFTLAIRIEENQPYNSVRQRSFYVGSNVYSRYEVVAMEWVVQEVLKFHCFSPTIYNFLWFYLKAVTADEGMQRKAKYLAGLSLLDHSHLRYWPSTVAAAAVILVSLAANRDEFSLRVMEAHVRTKVDDLPDCIKSLEWLAKYAW
ncbi:cyclin-SDS-like [Chenopodium quinoa]|uniref:cyclin-SDS-like n=1 Tax=Chenopodium quinoa TaxID=63459 RepID=UPI000B792B3C|nr:cyclin-SDS-like [Chenopodium quinoa]